MKGCLLITVMMITVFASRAQVHKIFINNRGEITKDSSKAVSYKRYQRLVDSSWLAVEYDMHNNAMFKGTFLDEELTMLHGKATYYHIVFNKYIVQGKGSFIDTGLAVLKTGYYFNGRKEGVWVDYFDNGNRYRSQTFIADTLDGPWEGFYINGTKYLEGNYVKGLKEGDWYLYYQDSTLNFYNKYVHGQSVKEKFYDLADKMHTAYPNYNFTLRVFNHLKKAGFPEIKGFVPLSFTITPEGRLVDPKVEVDDPKLNYAIIEAIADSPKWHAAHFKNKEVEQRVNVILRYRYKGEDY
jgi:antitoxin component YwqK of YwqJK toxin-antitoxin module